ncbi:hypothetical protein ADIS_3857 [Lunatimonas lonarensis]|uniref:Uncharacterized protein n=1 Tax=Lunatimonas lonarensis TaxID=1232681 RepID=R7ZNI8_9BACT|nr:hypothetical protein ADIS_3857 [Lunatimonas lonarensis]
MLYLTSHFSFGMKAIDFMRLIEIIPKKLTIRLHSRKTWILFAFENPPSTKKNST